MLNLHLTYKYLWWSRPTGPPRPPPEGLEQHWIDTPEGSLEVLSAVPAAKSRRSVPIVFAHGGMGGAWVWAEYMRYLAGQGIPCYAVSTRGHGESWHPSYLKMVFCTTRRMLADDLVAGVRWVEDREGSAVLLAGHSSGGGLCQAVLSEGDMTVKGLALLGSVPGFGSYVCWSSALVGRGAFSNASSLSFGVYWNWAKADPWFQVRLNLQGWHPNSPLSHPALVRRIFFSNKLPEPSLAQFVSRVNRYESYLWPFSMLTSFADPVRVLERIRNDAPRKVLVLTGSEDKLMTAPVMERLGMFYREAAGELGYAAADEAAEVAFVEGAGHHLQNDVGWEEGANKLLGFYDNVC
jgi:pimeloyl-ACP methyl ester carboxylesterase